MAKAEDAVYSLRKPRPLMLQLTQLLKTTTGQFTGVYEEISELAPVAVTMPVLEDAELLEGAAAPDPGTYECASNKFTRLHSPRTDEDDNDEPPSSSQETPDCSQQDNKRKRKTTHQLWISTLELPMWL